MTMGHLWHDGLQHQRVVPVPAGNVERREFQRRIGKVRISRGARRRRRFRRQGLLTLPADGVSANNALIYDRVTPGRHNAYHAAGWNSVDFSVCGEHPRSRNGIRSISVLLQSAALSACKIPVFCDITAARNFRRPYPPRSHFSVLPKGSPEPPVIWPSVRSNFSQHRRDQPPPAGVCRRQIPVYAQSAKGSNRRL